MLNLHNRHHQVYSKRDLETQPIKGGNVQEIGEVDESDVVEHVGDGDSQKGMTAGFVDIVGD